MEMQYLRRNIDAVLQEWSREDASERKPLLLRGARQVGKSSAVRQLGKQFKYFVEINFDENREVGQFFDTTLSPQDICSQLALYYRTPIVPGETLLFFDEVQSCQPALAKIRYFYEKYPKLHLIAAGSLLEFTLEEIPSFGVGRIRSFFMYPFSFDEFLPALGEGMLAEAIRNASPERPLPGPIHRQVLEHFKIFLICGGMPEAVSQYVRTGDLLKGEVVLNDLINTLKDDFAKYRKRVSPILLHEVFESVTHQAAGKFVYERAAPGTSAAQVRQTLELLIKAGLVHPVTHTAANGIPLGAEANQKYRRMIPCDTGIFLQLLGLRSEILPAGDFKAINQGALAEIFAGLELIKAASGFTRQELYCWQRSAGSSDAAGSVRGNAQVDYIIQKGICFVPVEVKAGTRGTMQSLRIFLREKQIKRGVRTSLENFGHYEDIDVYPLYAIGNLVRR
jgi:predicted AAA+ superfamily ATPase